MNTIRAFSYRGHSMKAKSMLAICGLCLLAGTQLSFAVDGAYQINAACAAVGCFPGDNPGYPVEITQSGTYDMVGSLTIADQTTTAILVEANNVTINMNGFRIIGPVTCNGTPVTCTPATSGGGNIGIDGWTYNPTNVVVRNGSVTGMGTGILASYDGRVEHIQAVQNGYAGIRARTGTAVTDSTGTYNGYMGIESRLMIGCVASHNGTYGLAAGGASLIKDSIAVSNDGYGIYLGTGTNVIGSTISNNDTGMFSEGSNQILDSMVANNRLFGLTNTQGVDTVARSTFIGNFSGGHQWGAAGTIVQTTPNMCGSSTTCP